MLWGEVGRWGGGVVDGPMNSPEPICPFNFFQVGVYQCINVPVMSLTSSIYYHFIILPSSVTLTFNLRNCFTKNPYLKKGKKISFLLGGGGRPFGGVMGVWGRGRRMDRRTGPNQFAPSTSSKLGVLMYKLCKLCSSQPQFMTILSFDLQV